MKVASYLDARPKDLVELWNYGVDKPSCKRVTVTSTTDREEI